MRRALSAIALTGDTASVTAVGNDYGYDEVFARQVAAHARGGDVIVLLSTSGRSPNVVAAARAARELGLTVYALTGPAPNPLSQCAADAVAVTTPATPVIQEVHQVAIHLVCDAVDRWVSGEHGPDAAMAQAAPARCATCGFRIALRGRLGQSFGVCANEISPSDGHIVTLDHGCGAHSEAVVIPTMADRPEPVVDEVGFETVERADASEEGPTEEARTEQGTTEQGSEPASG